jgi:hypothetical protein
MKISNRKTGTEGPSYDPYGYNEFDVETPKGTFKVHAGICLIITNKTTQEKETFGCDEDTTEDVCKFLGVTPEEWSTIVDDSNSFQHKGIHVGGALTVGTNGAAAAPAITVKTTGKQVKLSGGTTGGGGPPDDNAEYENPKAIKAQGRITINGGFISASTANSGGEGIESKDTITVNGGSIETACYDDGMNASTNITINGGTVFCNTSNNDGIDSNGTLTLNGGVVASFGAAAPEEGLDCDQNTFTVNGGTFVGCGGATSNPNAGSQYSMIYTGTVASNTVVRITNTSGSSIFAFRMPRTYSASVKLVCGTE